MELFDFFPYASVISSILLIVALVYRFHYVIKSGMVIKFVLIPITILVAIHMFRIWYFSNILLGTVAPSPSTRDLFRFMDIITALCLCGSELESLRLMFVPNRLRDELFRVYVQYEEIAEKYENLLASINAIESNKNVLRESTKIKRDRNEENDK